MAPGTDDVQVRQAAFDHVNGLAALKGGVLDSDDLTAGFQFQGERVPLVNPQRGIFKSRQMTGLLSIRTPSGRALASGTTTNARHISKFTTERKSSNTLSWAPTHVADNRWLRDAMERQIPIIYFLGTSPGRYQPIGANLYRRLAS